jgi:hypothetical protein
VSNISRDFLPRADDALLQPEPRAQFQKLLRQGWRDALRALHPDAALYTYWSYLRNRWPRDAGLRIDHLLLSALAAKRLAAAGVDREVRGEAGASDHAPAWVELKEAGGGRSSRASGSPRRGSAGRRSLARMSSGARLAGKSTAGKTLTNRCSEDFCAIRRANKSVGPPAANPTITFTVPPAKSPLRQWASNACYQVAQPIVARFFPLLGEFDRGGKPSIARVLASSCQNSPHAVSRSFT